MTAGGPRNSILVHAEWFLKEESYLLNVRITIIVINLYSRKYATLKGLVIDNVWIKFDNISQHKCHHSFNEINQNENKNKFANIKIHFNDVKKIETVNNQM